MLLFHIFFYFNLNHLPVIYLCMCAFLDSHPHIRIYVRECVCVCDRQNYMYVFWVTHTSTHTCVHPLSHTVRSSTEGWNY